MAQDTHIGDPFECWIKSGEQGIGCDDFKYRWFRGKIGGKMSGILSHRRWIRSEAVTRDYNVEQAETIEMEEI